MRIPLRVWILIIALIIALVAIKPTFQDGVVIKSTEDVQSASLGTIPRPGEIITSINGERIRNLEDYSNIMSSLFPTDSEVRLEIGTKTGDYVLLTNETPQFIVKNVPKTNIQAGLDIQGGARALIKPDAELTDSQMQDLIEVSRNRFNVFGISDVQIKAVKDLSGNQFMLVEVAGATPKDLEDLVSKQGKFEAKIGNETVFLGGNQDVVDVCRNDATCAAVTSCFPSEGGYACNFAFTIYLSNEAARRHAEITGKIPLDETSNGAYLSQNLDLVLDDVLVDSLRISSGLKGREATQISIQGSGSGATQEDAIENTRADMNKLQTILITGSLPYKMEIVKLDTISPTLGARFVNAILLAGLFAMLFIYIIIFVRYKSLKLGAALLLTSVSELIIILGVASFMKWNFDLPSIAALLATIGTGVDDQIIMLDESKTKDSVSMKERMKRAIFIMMSAYLTSLVSLLPLYWAGAGLFKGFAITSIIGISAGVFITRPAFAEILKRMES